MKTKRSLFLLFMLMPVALLAQEFKKRSNPVAIDVGNVVEAPKPIEVVADNNTKPVIIWISPDVASSSATVRKMTIKAGVNSRIKLRNVTLLVNGIEPVSHRGIGVTSTEASKFDSFIEQELDLSEGPNEIKITAENESGQITTESRMINVKSSIVSTLAPRTDYALLFATNEYDEWGDLVNPVFDAEAIKKDLEELYGYKVELVKDPTKSHFLTKLREYNTKNYLPDDQLFIFIAGHGKFDEVIKDGYIVARDSKVADENHETYISFSDLRT